jgi:hypothetical protein
MTQKERKELESRIRLMSGKRYVYTGEGCNDVVTVCHIAFDGDSVMMDTDCWNERFDITSYNEWGTWFEPTRKKSQVIERYQSEIADLKDELARQPAASLVNELRNEADRLEGVLAITEMAVQEKDERIRELAGSEIVIKNLDAELTERKTHISFLEHELETLRTKTAVPVEKSPAKHESVFPRIFDLLFATAGRIESNQLQIAQSSEIREICRAIADISETQHRAITMTKKPFIRKSFVRKNHDNFT